MAIDGTSCLPGSETERASQLRFDDGLKTGGELSRSQSSAFSISLIDGSAD